jgi:hypothetical protein
MPGVAIVSLEEIVTKSVRTDSSVNSFAGIKLRIS